MRHPVRSAVVVTALLGSIAACDGGPPASDPDGSSGAAGANAAGAAGSASTRGGAGGSATAGASAAAGTAGSSTTGSGTAGSSSTGSGTAGSSGTAGTAGNAAAGSAGTAGMGTAGMGTAGMSAAGASGTSVGGAGGGAGGGAPACKPGASQPAPDGCNTCTCNDQGVWTCTAGPCVGACDGEPPPCAPPPPGCDYVGGGCLAGKWTCGELACANTCTSDAQCPAIKIACHDCPGGGISCPQSLCVDGSCDIVWSACQGIAPGLACAKPGAQAPADDGCNTCTCADDLRWGCTKKACVSCEGPAPKCAAPPAGCAYENGGCVDGSWTCGTLVCPDACKADADCPQTKIACKACAEGGFSCPASVCVQGACALAWSACQGIAPGLACGKVGQEEPADDGCNTCTCGKDLVWSCTKKACVSCEGPMPPCAPPPAGCDYEGGGCVGGQWTCGKLVCEPQCKADSDCPQPGAPCQKCTDGSFACPSSRCNAGTCESSFPQCP